MDNSSNTHGWSGRVLIVADVNTIWRRKPFEAMSALQPVLGLAPRDVVTQVRMGRKLRLVRTGNGSLDEVPVILPPGWASRVAEFGQWLLWRYASRHCRRNKVAPSAVVVTSPHYVPLLNYVPTGIRTFYYASDDYRGYAGWDSHRMAQLEHAILQRVDGAVYVSRALAGRAAAEVPGAAPKISVSANATELRFFPPPNSGVPGSPPHPYSGLDRPIVGVVGGISDRLDYDLLFSCAELEEVRTLLLVGPFPQHQSEALTRLLNHPKCVAVGLQPHAALPQWMWSLDVALIPYREMEFNHYCSPMRLFDHLASGRPVVATAACDQVNQFADVVRVASTPGAFRDLLRASLQSASDKEGRERQLAAARQHTWGVRAERLARLLNRC